MPTVLVTRPSHQQANFLVLCQDIGLNTHSLPLIGIKPLSVDSNAWQSQLTHPDTAWIFTSRNAVEHCPFGLHPAGPVFAMGASTARALESIGHTLAVEPDVPFNSEALVAQLKQANTDKAVVVTGLGGRAYLGKELRSMNWAVTEIPCYERYFETHTKHAVTDALNTADILSLTSIESMDSLLEQSQHTNDNWQSKPLIVNSGRAKDAAKLAGFTGIIEVAIPAGDQGQIEAIKTVLNMS